MLTWAALSHHAPLRCSHAPVPPHMPNATWLSSMAHALPLHGCWIASPGRERVVHSPGRDNAISCSYDKYSLMQSFYEQVYEITPFLSQIALHKNARHTEDFSH